METIEQARAAIAELQARELELIAARNAAGREAAKGLVMEYDWLVTWPHPAKFKIERKATQATLARIAAWHEQFPNHPYPPKPFEGGMTYSLLEGGYVEGHGGSVIVQFEATEGYRASWEPEVIAPDVLAALRDCVCPDSIKKV